MAINSRCSPRYFMIEDLKTDYNKTIKEIEQYLKIGEVNSLRFGWELGMHQAKLFALRWGIKGHYDRYISEGNSRLAAESVSLAGKVKLSEDRLLPLLSASSGIASSGMQPAGNNMVNSSGVPVD